MNLEHHDIRQNLHSINDFIRWAASCFNQHQLYFGHGTENALDEAAYLVLFSLHLTNDLPLAYLQGRLTDAEKETIIELVEKRIETHLPAPYLTQQCSFAGLDFYVDERVLIPRSPIAELIEKRFFPWVDEQQVGHILDLCTGSGCIAIACAYAFLHAEIDAIDISKDALEVAKINIERHQAEQRVNLICSDLFIELEADSAYRGKYDIIVSNPPYVDYEDMSNLPAEYHAEPELGLSAGDDGLDLVIPMLQQVAEYLSDNGILVVEVGNSQYALAEAFPQVPFEWLEFEHGAGGVFVLMAEQLKQFDFIRG